MTGFKGLNKRVFTVDMRGIAATATPDAGAQAAFLVKSLSDPLRRFSNRVAAAAALSELAKQMLGALLLALPERGRCQAGGSDLRVVGGEAHESWGIHLSGSRYSTASFFTGH